MWMADLRIIAKAMDDLADDWHRVVLHDARQIESNLYFATAVDTVCGLLITAAPQRVRLFDMGAPDQPTCTACLDDGLGAVLRTDIESAIETAERQPTQV